MPTAAPSKALERIASDLLPSDEDVRFFHEHGWYITRKIFSDELLDEVLAAADGFYVDLAKGIRHGDERISKIAPGWIPEYGDCIRKTDYSALQNDTILRFVTQPIVGAIAARLSGSPSIRLWHDQMLYKPVDAPDRKTKVGWHTDRGYWQVCSSDNMLTCWVPLHDCDESMGTVTMIDGSNTWPETNQEFGRLDFFRDDLDELERNFVTDGKPVVKVPMNLKKGQASFHGTRTIHGSGANLSGRPRRSFAIHLQDEANQCRDYRFPNGDRAWHCNNDLCRKVDGKPDYTDPAICPKLWPVS